MIYTESDPSGGWWIESEGQGGQSMPNLVIDHLLIGALDHFAEKARTSRVVIIACGVNLLLSPIRKGVMEALQR